MIFIIIICLELRPHRSLTDWFSDCILVVVVLLIFLPRMTDSIFKMITQINHMKNNNNYSNYNPIQRQEVILSVPSLPSFDILILLLLIIITDLITAALVIRM